MYSYFKLETVVLQNLFPIKISGGIDGSGRSACDQVAVFSSLNSLTKCRVCCTHDSRPEFMLFVAMTTTSVFLWWFYYTIFVFSWYKKISKQEDELVHLSNRVKIQAGSLYIRNVLTSDSGTYMCRAHNTLGTRTTSTVLTVYGTYHLIVAHKCLLYVTIGKWSIVKHTTHYLDSELIILIFRNIHRLPAYVLQAMLLKSIFQ